jgi:hypothetical protein
MTISVQLPEDFLPPHGFTFDRVKVATCRLVITFSLIIGASLRVLGDEAINEPAPSQIIKKVQQTYASLTSYSDEGSVIEAGQSDATIKFSARLCRKSFYLIEWNRAGESSQSAQAVWSSGAGDFLQPGCGVQPQISRSFALPHAVFYFGRVTAIVPRMFFGESDPDLEGTFSDWEFAAERRADEKVGDISCYVLTRALLGETNTLWIGKQDFLIRQVRTEISADGMRAEAAAASLDYELLPAPRAIALTETHTNLVLNRKFGRTDFIPSVPLFPGADAD